MRMEMFCLPRMSATSGCFVQNAWVYLGHDSLSSSKDSHLVKALFEAGLLRPSVAKKSMSLLPHHVQPKTQTTSSNWWLSMIFPTFFGTPPTQIQRHSQQTGSRVSPQKGLVFHFMSCLLGEAQSLPQRQPTWKNPTLSILPFLETW